jgi:hypothetical protein
VLAAPCLSAMLFKVSANNLDIFFGEYNNKIKFANEDAAVFNIISNLISFDFFKNGRNRRHYLKSISIGEMPRTFGSYLIAAIDELRV